MPANYLARIYEGPGHFRHSTGQFAVDKVTDSPATESQWNTGCDEVGHGKKSLA